MPNQVILNLDESLLRHIDAEKERLGTTRDSTVVRILEKHFSEQSERQRRYDEWFVAEVNRGLRSLETEPLHDHDDVMRKAKELLEVKRMSHAPEMV